MLLKLLSVDDHMLLLYLLQLLALADKPLLWDGRKKEEITSETNLNNLSIQQGELESSFIDDLKAERNPPLGWAQRTPSVATRLVNKLKALSLHQAEIPEARVGVGVAVMRELLEGKKFELPSVPKLMLFELILLALCGGNISNIEWALLREFQHHHKLEDFVFDDLLERAEAMNREVSNTIAIILE